MAPTRWASRPIKAVECGPRRTTSPRRIRQCSSSADLSYSRRRGQGLPEVSCVLALLDRMRALELSGPDNRNRQTHALGWQNLAPPLNELLIRASNRPDVAVQIIEAKRVDVAVLLAKGAVPIDLVRQRVPGEAHNRHAAVAHAQDVGPLLPEPVHSLVAVRTLAEVRLRVHDRQLVALVVLPRDLTIAEHLARGAGRAVWCHSVLIFDVVVAPHHAVLPEMLVEEELVLVPGHAVVHQDLVHLRVDAPAVVEVERQIAAGVEDLGLIDRIRLIGVEVFRGLTLDKNRIRAKVEDGGHREHVRLDDVLERCHEGLIARELLVPPAVSRREGGAHKHLVHVGVELHPRKALGESAGVLGKELRKIRVLEVADPVRRAEVTEIDDWDDVEALQATECLVREVPVVATVSQPGPVDGWSIAQGNGCRGPAGVRSPSPNACSDRPSR